MSIRQLPRPRSESETLLQKGALDVAFVSASDTAGGAEAHTIALADGLLARGHQTMLFGRCPGWREAGLPISSLAFGPKWSGRHLARNLGALPHDHHCLLDVPAASVYYLQFKREQIAFTARLARRGSVVWTEHGRWINGWMGTALRPAYARAARHVAKIICVSDAVAADLAPIVGEAKLTVIPNAVDTDRFRPTSPQRRRALRNALLPRGLGNTPIALIASRLHHGKGHDRAISAALGSGAVLLVVGDGPDRARLESQYASSGKVLFLGWRDDIADIMAASDAYFYAGGPTDGMPIAVLEAIAAGLAVVGFAGDPGVELIERSGGIALPPGSRLAPQRLHTMLTEWSSAGRDYVAREHGRSLWLDRYEMAIAAPWR